MCIFIGRRLIITSCPTTHHVTYIPTVFEVLRGLRHECGGCLFFLRGLDHECGWCLFFLHGLTLGGVLRDRLHITTV
jgi:hypothetical protein